ncbi:hypothetical protein AB4307_19020 [Vibrio sp. 10N.261.52.C2]|uniref:hypothetical protein n=1 Tax=Vibrio sp. 10N.261.52.C2 TaxID=3229681 RepID=UPI00354DDDEB
MKSYINHIYGSPLVLTMTLACLPFKSQSEELFISTGIGTMFISDSSHDVSNKANYSFALGVEEKHVRGYLVYNYIDSISETSTRNGLKLQQYGSAFDFINPVGKLLPYLTVGVLVNDYSVISNNQSFDGKHISPYLGVGLGYKYENVELGIQYKYQNSVLDDSFGDFSAHFANFYFKL